ncbi:DUF1488 domain-containing protein [Cupriavidus oxalaticus]|jgi:hypothetical protein|uniref:DUF1488 domain-containing protein n=1 Tax=Cupriavidus oxalaticus TaxID=96344 RepID=A0A375FNZ5_9BURK|nr:DUF1488 domain-containing protein [Cupriavidus oxalaticus]QEZ46677.1 DUF1488 domain-containing protein [Cupriavidus oxalaticus]QRQ89003.1 DUF1488 domain-containing protein [Cupriavidus oxalaticus]QRQ95922.1 DUF1488 domain-containing protein [Cupriavidus oxalaticus]WQD84606.1 DUF1488 domain-containing protein [Cupriavidus oxalaticus]SPC06453.1 conserved hypothetical protein [Cupriavidus oxalaticus]
MYKIDFTGDVPEYCPTGPSLQCPVKVDGAPATYEITAEALEDHFGARSYRSEDLVPAFLRNRQDIERVAGALFEMTGAKHIVLHSGHFRFAV